MFEKVTNKMIMECADDLKFYDEHGHFPFEKKKVMITLSYASIEKLKGKNRSKEIEKCIC
jgi:hypothetical protein